MYQFRKKQSTANISLAKLSQIPSEGDINFLFSEASNNRGRFLEISWMKPEKPTLFVLTVKILADKPPTWMLYKGEGGNSQLLWGHESGDLSLIYNLVLLECDREYSAAPEPVVKSPAATAEAGSANDNLNLILQDILPPGHDNLFETKVSASVSSTPAQAIQNQTQLPPQTPAPAKPQPQPMAFANYNAVSPNVTGLPNPSSTQNPVKMPSPVNAPSVPDVPNNSNSSLLNNEVSQTMNVLATAAKTAAAPDSGVDLTGSLANISVVNLMRHIHQRKLTGRLSIYGGAGAAELFFKGGIVVHASTLETKGDIAVLDVITWREGEFHFGVDEETVHRTIEKNFETLFNECLILEKQINFVQAQGLTQDSYLQKMDLSITPAQFEQMVSGVVQVDAASQRKFFDAIDSRSTLSDVLRKHPAVKSEWIPIMYSLLNARLVSIAPKPLQSRSLGHSETIQVDQSLIYNVVTSLADPTTGIFSYPAFLYVLQREFTRFERSGGRFAIIVLDFGAFDEKKGESLRLSYQAINEAVERIDKRKRKLDLFAHFQRNSFVILLPETDSSGAYVFANRLCDILSKPPLTPEMEDKKVVISAGIASIPDDCRDLDSLLTFAAHAKRYASISHKPVILFSDIAQDDE